MQLSKISKLSTRYCVSIAKEYYFKKNMQKTVSLKLTLNYHIIILTRASHIVRSTLLSNVLIYINKEFYPITILNI